MKKESMVTDMTTGNVTKMGCQGFWFGDALAGFIPIVIGMTYYFWGNWKNKGE